MLVFEQGHLSRKNLSRAIFASVNYLSRALVKEELSNLLISDKCQVSVGVVRVFFFAAYSLVISSFVSHLNFFFNSRRLILVLIP